MAFFKFRWPGQSEPAPADKPAKRSRAAPPAESIEAMRRRARHRLIGAAVLVALGVVGFPLLFDTQPRPIAVDIPIEIPDRNKTAPVVVPAPAAAQAPSPAQASAAVARQPAPATPSSSRTAVGQASAGNGLSEGEEIIASPKPAMVPKPPVVAAAPKPEQTPKPEHKPELKPEPRPVAAAPAPAPTPAAPAARANDEAARARALLEGRTAAPAAAAVASASAEDARFIVQVGAFADADKAREARTKVERSGLKTFVQVVDTKDGKRTRVRVGPFNNRADADKAAGKIRALELSASVLTL